jgi:chromosomal replication initiator protein
MHSFARWITTPENRSALLAVQRVADCLGARRHRRAINPLFLHGAAGTGKTHLVSALVREATTRRPDLVVAVLSPGEEPGEEASPSRALDLLILEDVQHLAAAKAEAWVQRFDERLVREQQMVFTATVGPCELVHLPARLTSRLACGLVVGLEVFSPEGRLAFLCDGAQRRQLPVRPEVLAWLAEHVGGSGRQLEGALLRLETLVRLHKTAPGLDEVAAHFRTEAEAAQATVEHIAQRVSRYFQVPSRDLVSRRRCHRALMPRQIGMYLARQLTPLSLHQIGAYFGGRDHSTVLHACRKVEQALTRDAVLSGAVRELHADLR